MERQTTIIHRLGDGEAEQRGFYRLLHNEGVQTEEVKRYIYDDCLRQVEQGHHYLVIQDTTQPNFERNRANIRNKEGLGVIGDRRSLGFFLHPSLVLDASSGRCLGFSHIETWSRAENHPTKEERNFQRLPIEEKESYRWISSTQASRERLRTAGACMLTVIADREGDIGDMFKRREDAHLLIRSRVNRHIKEGRLYEYLSSEQCAGSYRFEIRGDARIGRATRTAKIEVRYAKIHVVSGGDTIEMYGIEAREVNAPAAGDAVLWRLLTTHEITSYEQACTIITWYGLRWNIEQVFRLLKQKGFDIESSEMETGKSLIVLTLLSLLTISKVITLHRVLRIENPQPINGAFTAHELLCLALLCRRYEGRTQKQKNPHPPDSLQWCAWVIARLGSWKPNEKSPGVLSILWGWLRFHEIYDGFVLAQNSFVS